MYQKTVLPNGLRIVSSTMPSTRSVTIAFYVGAGSRYETTENNGISHFVEHVLFKGTLHYPEAKHISEGIEGVGGMLNASTDREVTTYWCKIAREHFSTALHILADMLIHPLLVPQELEKERQVIIEELHMTNDDPSSRADIVLDELLWPNQPLGRDVGGTEESVLSISRSALLEYIAHQYCSQNTVVSVAGNIAHEEVVDEVTKTLGAWERGETLPWSPSLDQQTSPQIMIETRKTDQAHLCLGFRGLSSTHPDRYALDLLSAILGEGMSSRLFQELRERLALAYDIHSYPNHLLDCGSLNISAGVHPKRVSDTIVAIMQQLHAVKDGIPESELNKAKQLSKGRLLIRMEDTHSVAGWMGAQEILHNRILNPDQVLDEVDTITPEQIQRVATEVLVTEKTNLAMVGPQRSRRNLGDLLRL